MYTRVYSSLLGRRYSLGMSRLRHRYFYLLSSIFYLLSSVHTPSRPCPRIIVISYISPGRGTSSYIPSIRSGARVGDKGRPVSCSRSAIYRARRECLNEHAESADVLSVRTLSSPYIGDESVHYRSVGALSVCSFSSTGYTHDRGAGSPSVILVVRGIRAIEAMGPTSAP